ncbi:MAG: CooT family nickel-binding protein [Oscillospiraceae bacterium]|nr:CooT family nickel-binding protein [Oscillospiraceae bacterium]
MCLATVYFVDSTGERAKVADSITEVAVDGLQITITDLLGGTTVLNGSIQSVDLVGNSLVVVGA